MNRTFLFLMTIAILTSPMFIDAEFSFKKVSSYFNATPHETTMHKKIPCKSPGIINVKNLNGAITIKAEWDQNSIVLSAVKKAANPNDLRKMDCSVTSKNNNTTIESKYDATITGSMDYTLLVPAASTLHLTTGNGAIVVHNAHGALTVTTNEGNIDLFGAKDVINATCKKTGSITIHQPSGPINASAHRGSILVYDARDSVIAHTQQGTINLSCKKLPATGKLTLKTVSGPITVHLPPNTNAELDAQTKRGHVASKHLVTLKPFTTELNRKAWKKFKKEIRGTLGTGEADIKLHAQNGSIKILHYA